MITLVTQSFGKESEYKRVIFSILSVYAQLPPTAWPETLFFTDTETFFTPFFKGLPVKYSLLNTEKIKKMRGEIDFLHRMKIALLEEAFETTKGSLIYFDSDTFFTGDPTPFFEQLSTTNSFMHQREYQLKEVIAAHESNETKAFFEYISRKPLEVKGNEKINWPELYSWNAGVMMLHASHFIYIDKVYKLTDEFYRASKSHASEQYAFSIMLQLNTNLNACDAVVYHYWHRVKKQIIDGFFAKEMPLNWGLLSLNDKLRSVKHWTLFLPPYFDKHVYTYRDNAIISFCERKYAMGYKWAAKAFFTNPFGDKKFLKDVLYYTKQGFKKSGND